MRERKKSLNASGPENEAVRAPRAPDLCNPIIPSNENIFPPKIYWEYFCIHLNFLHEAVFKTHKSCNDIHDG